jgi:hypothetical protein
MSQEQKVIFQQKCKETGEQYFRKPQESARSIVQDWSPRVRRELFDRYELYEDGRLHWVMKSARLYRYFDFREERLIKPDKNLSYQRWFRAGERVNVASPSADILVFYDISDPVELDKPVKLQKSVNYTITVMDRRTNEPLAKKTYWIDHEHGRACGADEYGVIDVNEFILRAVDIWDSLPEKERRQLPKR